MAPPLHSGGRSLRAAWERQQRAAELAACVARIPQLARSKPAFFAVQLQPVLAALQQVAAAGQQEVGQEEGAEAAEGGLEVQEQQGSAAQSQLAAAAAHLRRLAGTDRHVGANASLLLCLLLGMAAQGEEPQLQGGHVAQLCAALGWHALLLEVLSLLLVQQWPGQGAWLAELVAATATAAAAASSDAQEQAPVEQVTACLAFLTQQQLESYGSSGSSGGSGAAQQALLAGMAALQQLLLAAPAMVAAPGAATALRQLQASADASMAGLMQAMQAPGEQQAAHQAVFQQLCQLRARLMLAFAGAAGAADAGSSTATAAAAGGDAALAAAAAERPHVMPESRGQLPAAQAWRSLLLMPPDAAAAAAAARGGAVVRGCSGMALSRQQLLAAWVAATSYVRASASSGASSGHAGAPSSSGSAAAEAQPAFQSEVPGLPGVHFAPPALLSRGSCGGDVASFEAAAEAAAEQVAREPDCLGPAHLTLAALQLAQQVVAGTASPTETAPARATGGGAAAAAAPTWPMLLELACAAAASATGTEARQQLLLLLLHGRQAWLCQLRQALAADAELQRSCRRELVAVANRLASEAGAGGRGAPAVVHGEERRRRTAAAVAALLPHALLCPAAVLERLVKQAVVQAGEQVDLLLDVLHEMAPLAAYCPHPHQPPLLLTLLARLLQPEEQGGAAAGLDTPGSRDAFLQLVAGLCGCRPTPTGKPTAPAAPGVQQPLLSAAAVLEHVVAPALQLQQQEGGVAAQVDLLLPLQLTQLLAGALPAAATAGTPAAGAAADAQQPDRQLAGLRPQLQALLHLGGRRVDRTAGALQASPETFELAATILQRMDSDPASADASAAAAAAGYFRQQLQAAGKPGAGAQQQQQVAQLRQRLVQLLAALLPCATAAEAAGLLQAALPGAIQELMLPPAAQQQAGGRILPGAHAAAVEAACRAVHALALAPSQAPIAGEEPAAAAGTAAAAAAAGGPSPLRQLAVERALQHLTQHCASLAAAGATEVAASAAQPTQQPRLQPAEAQALGLRCVRELCQLVAALQPSSYDCSTLQVGLLQLARQLLAHPAVGAAGAAAAATQQQQQLVPAAQVRQQLEAAAAGLPEGRLRDLLLLGIQQASAE